MNKLTKIQVESNDKAQSKTAQLTSTELHAYFTFISQLPLRKNDNGLYSANFLVGVLHKLNPVSCTSNSISTENNTFTNLVMLDQFGAITLDLKDPLCEIGVLNSSGDTMTLAEVRQFIDIQSSVHNMYIIHTTKQTDNPVTSSMCPWVLYAFAIHKGIQYREWDRSREESKSLAYLLRAMQKGVQKKGTEYSIDPSFVLAGTKESVLPILSNEQLKLLSRICRTTSTGKTRPETTYKFNLTNTGIKGLESVGKTIKYEPIHADFDQLPVTIRRTLTQTWLFSPAVRKDCLILDPTDWSNIPEPLQDLGYELGLTKKAKLPEILSPVEKPFWDDIDDL